MENNYILDEIGEKFTSYNVQDFADGKENVLLITGFSGSGKSTLAERFAYKFDIKHIDLDNIDPKYDYIYEQKYSNKNEIFYDFLDAYPELNEKIQGRDSYKYRKELFDKFFDFCFKWCKEHHENKYIIEGTQIYEFPENINRKKPIIVMNTSAKESADRIYKRDLNYNKNITSKENIEKLESFSNSLKEFKEGEASMLNISDSTKAYKILPLSLELYYKFKTKTNNLGKCKFDKDYTGLIVTEGNKLLGYIILKNRKMTALEVLPEGKELNLKEKLIRLAIERCGLNEITVNASNLKTLKLLSSIGFNKISKINDKILLKLPSIMVRKNDYQGLIVKRENGEDITSKNEEYVYYFYEKTNIQKPIGRIVVNVPKNEIVDFTITEEKHSDDNFKKMLDFAVLEKGYTNIRVLFGKKEMVEKLTDYGFVIAQRVKNSKGKFYIMELKNKMLFETPEKLSEWMQENVIPSEFTLLMKPIEVEKEMTGSSHDQAQFMLDKIPYKYNPNSILVLEKTKDDRIVKAITCVYYTEKGKIYWIENVLDDAIGINGPYNSVDGLEEEIQKKFDYVNKEKDHLDFVPVYVKFHKPVTLDEYIKSICSLEEE